MEPTIEAVEEQMLRLAKRISANTRVGLYLDRGGGGWSVGPTIDSGVVVGPFSTVSEIRRGAQSLVDAPIVVDSWERTTEMGAVRS